ncbi:MAG: hypothetical protein ABIR33_03730 [Pyrinomonadaceae bacterium]
MLDWFLSRQFYIALIVGIVCVSIVTAIDYRGIQSLVVLLISLGFIYLGDRLFDSDTTENWLTLSFSQILKNAFGSALILIGWGLFLRGLLAVTIAALLLWAD